MAFRRTLELDWDDDACARYLPYVCSSGGVLAIPVQEVASVKR